MEKVLFAKSISKIKNNVIREYFNNLFKTKNVFAKLLIFSFSFAFVLGLSFTTRHFMLIYNNDLVVLNPGIAFSGLKDVSSNVVLVVQLLPTIISFIIALFLNDWYLYIFLFLISAGGLSNVIDRFVDDIIHNSQDVVSQTVVDYFHAKGSVFNLPDSFVVFGAIGLGIFVFIKIFIIFKEDKKNEVKNR